MQIDHLHLQVACVERSAAFYERHFGLRRHIWHGDVLFLRDAAGMDLALAPGLAGDLPAWFHIGFRLESAQAVCAKYAALTTAGVPMREPLTEEIDLTYFRAVDPDGYGIEIYWEPQPA